MKAIIFFFILLISSTFANAHTGASPSRWLCYSDDQSLLYSVYQKKSSQWVVETFLSRNGNWYSVNLKPVKYSKHDSIISFLNSNLSIKINTSSQILTGDPDIDNWSDPKYRSVSIQLGINYCIWDEVYE